MRLLTAILLLLSTLPTLAQMGAGVAAGRWEPRNYKTKLGLVADWDPGNASSVTLNGAGVAQVLDRSWQTGRLENLLVQSETFATTWTLTRCNAFGATDTGATNAGSFANTARTLDPLGGNTADFIQEDATAANNHRISQSYAMIGDGTISVYAKPAGRNWLYIVDGTDGIPLAYFDVQNGLLGSSAGCTPTIIPAANGFYKCTIAFSGNFSGNVFFAIANVDGGYTYNGNSTDGLFIWGAQLRRSTSSSVYYPTVSTAEDASRSLNQTTAGNQPLISRADNKGNLLVQSETFTTTWTLTRCNAFGATDTGATNAGSFANTARTLDPLGGNTADFIQEDATATSTHVLQQTIALETGSYSLSIYAKYAGRRFCNLYLGNSGGTDALRCGFDIQNGLLGTSNNVGTATGIVGSITSIGNGWYLCGITGNLPSAAPNRVFIYLASGGAATDTIYTGNATDGLFIWGASLRQSSWDSDYVSTVATIAVPGLGGRKTLYHDGSAHYLKTAGMASLVQPETVIWAGKQVTWTANDRIHDGNSLNTVMVRQDTTSPNLRPYAGSFGGTLTNMSLGTYGAVTELFSGTNSFIQLNKNTQNSGDTGTTAGSGFTLGADGAGAEFSNIQVARVLVSNKVLATNELEFLRWGPLKYVGAK